MKIFSPTITGSSNITGSVIITGSLNVSGSIIGTTTQAISSSYALTASYALNGGSGGGGGYYIATGSVTASVGLTTGSFTINSGSTNLFTVDNTGAIAASSAVITGNVIVQGTASINTLIVNQTQLSTGSNQLGDASNDFQTLYGTVRIPTGSLTVTGSTISTGGFTGSLFGTASYVPTLDQATTSGNTTTNAITVGLINSTALRAIVSITDTTGGINNPSYFGSYENFLQLAVNRNPSTGIYAQTGKASSQISLEGDVGTSSIRFYTTTTNNSIPSERLRIFGNGNITINTATDSGFKLDVSGSGRFSGNLTITGSATNSLLVKGSGTTGATNAMVVQNSNASNLLTIQDNGYVGIGTTTPTYTLDVNGNFWITKDYLIGSGQTTSVWNRIKLYNIADGSIEITMHNSSWYIRHSANMSMAGGMHVGNNTNTDASSILQATSTTKGFLPPRTNLLSNISNPAQGLITYLTSSGNEGLYYYNSGSYQGWTEILNNSGSQNITGSLSILGIPSTSSTALTVYKSGSTVVDVQGSSGQLFSITDSLSGSLFSVNTVAGLPVMEAFSDNTVNIGKFGIYPIKVVATGSLASITGSFTGSFAGSIIGIVPSASYALTASYVNPLTQSVLISGSISATTNIQSYQLNSSYGSVIGGRFYSDTLIAAGTVTYGSYGTSNVANLDIYANNANIGNGAQLRLSSRFGGDNGAYLVSSQTGSVVLAVDGTGNSGLVLNGSTMNVGIGLSTPTARLQVKGSGTTSATTALLVQNANASSSLVVLDNGFVGINTGSAAYNLDVNGDVRVLNTLYFNTSSPTAYISNVGTTLTISSFSSAGSIDLTANNGRTVRIVGSVAGSSTPFQIPFTHTNSSGTGTLNLFNINPTINNTGTFAGTVRGLYFNPTLTSTVGTDIRAIETTAGSVLLNGGRVSISGSAGTGSALTVYKSGSTVLDIQGSQGQLFSITDSLSGSLFSVSNISGLPILEVFSDNTTLIGNYLAPALITTYKSTINSGSTVIYSMPTSSYDGAFFDYTLKSGSNARAGQIVGIWSETSASFTETTTVDFGNTSTFNFGMYVTGSNMILSGSATTSGWTLKTIIRTI